LSPTLQSVIGEQHQKGSTTEKTESSLKKKLAGSLKSSYIRPYIAWSQKQQSPAEPG
jgi:hypothetical protein